MGFGCGHCSLQPINALCDRIHSHARGLHNVVQLGISGGLRHGAHSGVARCLGLYEFTMQAPQFGLDYERSLHGGLNVE
jgi:hypothetical protein